MQRGWLGVSVEEREGVVLIANLDRAGPAGRAGIRQGDIVVSINGERIETARGLIRSVAAVPPGNNARVVIRRQGRDIEVPVTVGRRPTEAAG